MTSRIRKLYFLIVFIVCAPTTRQSINAIRRVFKINTRIGADDESTIAINVNEIQSNIVPIEILSATGFQTVRFI